MANQPEQVVWEALKPVMPPSSAAHVSHIVVTALSRAGWIAMQHDQATESFPQPAEAQPGRAREVLPDPADINWDALTPEMFEDESTN